MIIFSTDIAKSIDFHDFSSHCAIEAIIIYCILARCEVFLPTIRLLSNSLWGLISGLERFHTLIDQSSTPIRDLTMSERLAFGSGVAVRAERQQAAELSD